jgi:hypothetical protein
VRLDKSEVGACRKCKRQLIEIDHYGQARLEDEAQCLLVIIGATAEGKKELVGLADGIRESVQSWKELLLDLKRRGLTIARSSPLPTGRSASGRRSMRCGRRRERNAAGLSLSETRATGVRDRSTAARSPWQNGYCERAIGSIRRDCLDHVMVLGERHLLHLLRCYASYYNRSRTHLSLNKDAPTRRPVHTLGSIEARPVLGGLHHHYVRI